MTSELNVPDEVKEKINLKLVENGSMEQIENEIKKAMKAAAKEIRNNKELAESELHYHPLKDLSEKEMEAFKAVIKFFEDHGLKFTLATLLEECGIEKPAHESALPINEYLTAVKKPEGDKDDDSDSDIVVVPAKQE